MAPAVVSSRGYRWDFFQCGPLFNFKHELAHSGKFFFSSNQWTLIVASQLPATSLRRGYFIGKARYIMRPRVRSARVVWKIVHELIFYIFLYWHLRKLCRTLPQCLVQFARFGHWLIVVVTPQNTSQLVIHLERLSTPVKLREQGHQTPYSRFVDRVCRKKALKRFNRARKSPSRCPQICQIEQQAHPTPAQRIPTCARPRGIKFLEQIISSI